MFFDVFLAYALATAFLLSFRPTRWLGAVALFVVLCVAPVLSSLLLIVIAAGCFFYFGKPKWNDLPRKRPWRD